MSSPSCSSTTAASATVSRAAAAATTFITDRAPDRPRRSPVARQSPPGASPAAASWSWSDRQQNSSTVQGPLVDPVKAARRQEKPLLLEPADGVQRVAAHRPVELQRRRLRPRVRQAEDVLRIEAIDEVDRLFLLVELRPVEIALVAHEKDRRSPLEVEDPPPPARRVGDERRARHAVDVEHVDVPDPAQRRAFVDADRLAIERQRLARAGVDEESDEQRAEKERAGVRPAPLEERLGRTAQEEVRQFAGIGRGEE